MKQWDEYFPISARLHCQRTQTYQVSKVKAVDLRVQPPLSKLLLHIISLLPICDDRNPAHPAPVARQYQRHNTFIAALCLSFIVNMHLLYRSRVLT